MTAMHSVFYKQSKQGYDNSDKAITYVCIYIYMCSAPPSIFSGSTTADHATDIVHAKDNFEAGFTHSNAAHFGTLYWA